MDIFFLGKAKQEKKPRASSLTLLKVLRHFYQSSASKISPDIISQFLNVNHVYSFQVASNRAKHMAVDETDQFHILLEQSNFMQCL